MFSLRPSAATGSGTGAGLRGAVDSSHSSSSMCALQALKQSTAAMHQDKEASRQSEQLWRDKLEVAERLAHGLELQLRAERAAVGGLRAQVSEHEQQFKGTSERVETLQVMAAGLQEQVVRLATQADAGKQVQAETFKEFESHKERLKAAQAKNAELSDNTANLQKALKSAVSQVQGREAEIQSMRQSVKERDLQLQKRERETAQQADELALLRKSLSNSKEGVAKLEATNSKQNFELDKLAQELAQVRQEQVELLNVRDALAAAKSALDGKLEMLTTELATLAAQAQALQLELTKEREERAAEGEANKVELSEAKRKLSDAVVTTAAMQAELDTVAAQLKATSAETDELLLNKEAQLSGAAQAHAELTEELGKTKAALDCKDALAAQLSGRVADLTMAEASLHEQLCAVKATCASQGAALLTVQKDTDAARSAFATTFVQHMVSTALLHARLNEAEAQQVIAQQAAKASTTTLEQSGAEVEQLRASMAAQCRDMTALQEELQQLKSEAVTMAQMHACALAQQKNSLEDTAKKNIDALEQRAAAHFDGVVKSFQVEKMQAVENAKREVAELCKKIETLEAQAAELQTDLNSKAKAAAQAQSRVEAAEATLATKESDAKAAAEMGAAAAAAARAANEELAVAKLNADEVKSRAARAAQQGQDDLQAARAQVAEALQANASLEADVAALRVRLEAAQDETALKDAEMRELKAQVDKRNILLRSIADPISTDGPLAPVTDVTPPTTSQARDGHAPHSGGAKKKKRDRGDKQNQHHRSEQTTDKRRKGPGGFSKPQTGADKSQSQRRGRMARMTTSAVSERSELKGTSEVQSHGRGRSRTQSKGRPAGAAQPAGVTHCDLLGSFMINPLEASANAL